MFVEDEGTLFNAYISGDEGVIETLKVATTDYSKFVSHLELNQIDYIVR